MFDLNPELCAKAVEHKTAFDILHAVVTYIRAHQRGFGVVGVSPRCARARMGRLSRLRGLRLSPGSPWGPCSAASALPPVPACLPAMTVFTFPSLFLQVRAGDSGQAERVLAP
jgi:hypothetical protein